MSTLSNYIVSRLHISVTSGHSPDVPLSNRNLISLFPVKPDAVNPFWPVHWGTMPVVMVILSNTTGYLNFYLKFSPQKTIIAIFNLWIS